MSYSQTIAIAKGRVLDEVESLWPYAEWQWPMRHDTRQLWFRPNSARPGLIIARGSDIPALVQRGVAAFGIVGKDILEEKSDVEVLEVLDLTIASCRMVLAGFSRDWPQGPQRVATKYPLVAERFFAHAGHPVEIVTLSGSLELAPHIGLAPYIVDLVQTGRTLSEHHLKEVATLFVSTARLIANPVAWRLDPESGRVFSKMKAAVIGYTENWVKG